MGSHCPRLLKHVPLQGRSALQLASARAAKDLRWMSKLKSRIRSNASNILRREQLARSHGGSVHHNIHVLERTVKPILFADIPEEEPDATVSIKLVGLVELL